MKDNFFLTESADLVVSEREKLNKNKSDLEKLKKAFNKLEVYMYDTSKSLPEEMKKQRKEFRGDIGLSCLVTLGTSFVTYCLFVLIYSLLKFPFFYPLMIGGSVFAGLFRGAKYFKYALDDKRNAKQISCLMESVSAEGEIRNIRELLIVSENTISSLEQVIEEEQKTLDKHTHIYDKILGTIVEEILDGEGIDASLTIDDATHEDTKERGLFLGKKGK